MSPPTWEFIYSNCLWWGQQYRCILPCKWLIVLPDTYVLVLVSELLASIKVVGLDSAGCGAVKVLGAALWSQVVVVATVLSDLECLRWLFLRWPQEQVWKGCRQSGGSLAVGQVNREWLVSPSIPSHTRSVAKRTNWPEDSRGTACLRMPKLD